MIGAVVHHADARLSHTERGLQAPARKGRHGEQALRAPAEMPEQVRIPEAERPGVGLGVVEHGSVMQHADLRPGMPWRRAGQVQQQAGACGARQGQLLPGVQRALAAGDRAHLDGLQRRQHRTGRAQQHPAFVVGQRGRPRGQLAINRQQQVQRHALHTGHRLRGELAVDVDAAQARRRHRTLSRHAGSASTTTRKAAHRKRQEGAARGGGSSARQSSSGPPMFSAHVQRSRPTVTVSSKPSVTTSRQSCLAGKRRSVEFAQGARLLHRVGNARHAGRQPPPEVNTRAPTPAQARP